MGDLQIFNQNSRTEAGGEGGGQGEREFITNDLLPKVNFLYWVSDLVGLFFHN